MASKDQWGADTPVSMPQPLPRQYDSLVSMGGFTMTDYGLFFDLSAADHERLSRPVFAPRDLMLPTDESIVDEAEVEHDREFG